jgi:hypothetical protein
MGIECDGANYHRAKTARDRDKLREAVLRDLGWELHRVWSTDWWTNPEREIEKLREALSKAQEPAAANEPVVMEQFELQGVPPQNLDDFSQSTASSQEGREPEAAMDLMQYQVLRVDRVIGSMEEFYESHAVSIIQDKIREVVQAEGPVSLGLAAKRVASFWGFDRVRARPAARIRKLIPASDVAVQLTTSDEFLWPATLSPTEYTSFRVPGSDGSGARQAVDLPLEEIGNASMFILGSHLSGPVGELIRETARLFGFARVGRVVESRCRLAITGLAERGRVLIDGENITLIS